MVIMNRLRTVQKYGNTKSWIQWQQTTLTPEVEVLKTAVRFKCTCKGFDSNSTDITLYFTTSEKARKHSTTVPVNPR